MGAANFGDAAAAGADALRAAPRGAPRQRERAHARARSHIFPPAPSLTWGSRIAAPAAVCCCLAQETCPAPSTGRQQAIFGRKTPVRHGPVDTDGLRAQSPDRVAGFIFELLKDRKTAYGIRGPMMAVVEVGFDGGRVSGGKNKKNLDPL